MDAGFGRPSHGPSRGPSTCVAGCPVSVQYVVLWFCVHASWASLEQQSNGSMSWPAWAAAMAQQEASTSGLLQVLYLQYTDNGRSGEEARRFVAALLC
ncbi:hypothetical protein J1614_004547 [Plenodomus biglobosus]|nr:hypothetical protein J1614_004547 [Plenodomus biglobosus]